MVMTNNVKGWIGVLMTEDSSSHWPIKRRYVYSKTYRRAGLEFVCIFGHDGINNKIRVLQRRAYGYRAEEYLKLKIVAAFLPPLPRNAVFNPHESA